MRRLFLIALSSAIILSACGSSKSWPVTATNRGSQVPATAIATPIPTEPPTPTEPPIPTEAPTPTEPPTPTEGPVADWTTFSPSGGGFSVLLPGKPELTSKTFTLAAGNAPGSLWTYEISNDLAFFLVQAKFPKGAISGKAPSPLLDAEVARLVSNVAGSTLTDKADITLNGHPGKRFAVDQPDLSVTGALFVVNDDILIVYVGYTTANDDTADIDTFLGSFKITV